MSERRTQAEEVEEERKEKMHMTMTGDRRGGCWERKKASKTWPTAEKEDEKCRNRLWEFCCVIKLPPPLPSKPSSNPELNFIGVRFMDFRSTILR